MGGERTDCEARPGPGVTSDKPHHQPGVKHRQQYLPHDWRRGEPGSLIQNSLGQAGFQSVQVALSDEHQILGVVCCLGFLPGHVPFNKPGGDKKDRSATVVSVSQLV